MNGIGLSRCKRFVALVAVLTSACATAQPPDAGRALEAQTASHPAGHIFVTAATLNEECYKEVGEVNYVEPFDQAATDPDYSEVAVKLRQIAQQKYPEQVDAIIGVHGTSNELGTEVLVSGLAVQVEDQTSVGCTLQKTMGTAAGNFATNSLSHMGGHGARGNAGATSDTGGEGSAAPGTSRGGMGVQQVVRNAVMSKTADQTDEGWETLDERFQSQRRQIESLRHELDQMIRHRCETADLSASECASLKKTAGVDQASASAASGSASDEDASRFEIENRIQAQAELITRLRREIADMKRASGEAGSTASSPGSP